jgi:hypothetical protein
MPSSRVSKGIHQFALVHPLPFVILATVAWTMIESSFCRVSMRSSKRPSSTRQINLGSNPIEGYA